MRAPVARPLSWALVCLFASFTGCALTVTGVDEVHELAAPPPPRCAASDFQLVRRDAEVLFVVDRSGSMSTAIATSATGYVSRWDALHNALVATLPRYESALTLGLFLFPNNSDSCGIRADDRVDVAPARNNATEVLRELRRFGPNGRTPTGAAILYGARYLLRRAASNVSRTLVLATDGAPTCTVGGGDEVADAVSAIAMARAQGISTHVIGISAPGETTLVSALDRMAVAGGHPLAGPVRHYAIHDPAALERAFTDIPRSLSECTWHAPVAAPMEGVVTLRAGAVTIPRDPTRRDGWDWTDPTRGEVTLYGSACARFVGQTRALDASVTCAQP
jgi:hypothetical protein